MEALRDLDWMKLLYAIGPAERFKHGRFRVMSLVVPSTPKHHNERYRYRLLFFEGLSASPSIAVNLESDLLGAWLLTVQSVKGRRVAASFDAPIPYDSFKELALPSADIEIGEAMASGGASTDAARRDILKA